MLDCLSNLVGLTDKDCECFSGSEPAEFEALNESETGYFLTDEDYGLPMLESVYAGIDCGDEASIFGVLQKARTHSINAIYTDLQAALLKNFDKTIQPFSGLIGQRRATTYKTISSGYAGLLLQPNPIKDAAFVVTHIWLGANQTGNITVTFQSNDPDFDTVAQTVNITQAGVTAILC